MTSAVPQLRFSQKVTYSSPTNNREVKQEIILFTLNAKHLITGVVFMASAISAHLLTVPWQKTPE